ncbi:MAG: hypothetical protein IJQ33_03065 [Clostridia bacterium]|nr:hypothetical protein [Clostridia bacterium]
MKKLISVLLLACMLVMPFAAMAEAAEAEEAAAVENLQLPEGWTAVEVSDEDAEKGVLFVAKNGEKVLTISIVATEGKTVEQLVEEAKNDGVELEVLDAESNLLGFDMEVEGVVVSTLVLVYVEEGFSLNFSFSPCSTEEDAAAFLELVNSLSAQL